MAATSFQFEIIHIILFCLIFPTCIECKACYHKACFKSGRCPRCERLQARRELLAKQSLESYMSDYEEEPTEALALEATVLETT